MRSAFVVSVAAVVSLSGCTGYGGHAGNDPQPLPYPWCAGEARDAASQPLPADASAAQRQAMRDYHMSKECQKATEQSVEVSFPAKRTP